MSQPKPPPSSATDRLPSYRARYALIVVVLAIAFSLVAALAYRYVQSQSASSSAEAARREQSVVFLNDSFGQLYHVRQELHEFLLSPSERGQEQITSALKQLDSALARLAKQGEHDRHSDFGAIALSLCEDAEDLGKQIVELVSIRRDPKLWFPATRLIEDQLQPDNSLFVANLDALLVSLQSSTEPPKLELLTQLYDVQKTWLRMIDELRLVIANRFGVHSADPLSGMATRNSNVRMYVARINRQLAELKSAQQAVGSDPLLQTQIDELVKLANEHQAAQAQLMSALNGSDWRTDLSYLRSQVDPLLQRMQQRLEILRTELQAQRRQQVDMLTSISVGLGKVLLAAVTLMLLFGVAGYLSLDHLILRPIRLLAASLKDHARHTESILPTPSAVRETHDLVNAFAEMQAQVRARERELDYLAHHDALTGLPNRSLFRRRLSEAIAAAGLHGMQVGVLFMDLDRFKQVNDSYGHAAGDQMLVEISRRLRKVFRQEDVIARLGGDEFAVLLENLHERDEMTRLAEKALGAIQRPYEFDGHIFYSGASIGIAVSPDDSSDPDRLIQQADAAMYAAKQDEGSSFRYVSAELTASAAAQHALENELREAIRLHQLELHFQPVISLSDGHIHSYESLLRWPHAQQGMLQPAAFMNALADAGLCSTISDWALDRIQGQRPTEDAVISINLSARLLHDEAFAQRLLQRIDEGGLAPERLILEITEDTLETDLRAAARVLHKLKQRGVRIALDDFGTGQASLSHLRRFPFDYIKIDQSFIAGIGTVRNDEKLIQAIIRLAHALGMQVVAEGVETELQRRFLGAENCDYIQGFLVGRPSANG